MRLLGPTKAAGRPPSSARPEEAGRDLRLRQSGRRGVPSPKWRGRGPRASPLHLEGEGYALAIPRNASSNTPAGCPPEISHFPSTTTAGTPLIPRETHSASAARTSAA